MQLEGSVGRKLYSLGREQSRGLMMAVASVHAAPAVNYNSGAEAADHADHIFDDLIAPDPFRFLRSLRKAKIFGASEEKPHSVAARGRQQFLCADQSELWRLFGPKVVLSALAAREGKQSDISMKPAGKVSEHSAALVVRMSCHVEDACGDASLLDRFDGFRQARARTRRRRKLRVAPRTEQT